MKFVAGLLHLDLWWQEKAPAELSVIGAGFSRTGTKSLQKALQQLGHKVYDTRSMLKHGDAKGWVEAARQLKQQNNDTMVKQMLARMESYGYTATLDWPMNLFAPALADLRPNAKVLMSVRKNERVWVESLKAVFEILGVTVLRPWKWFVDLSFPATILKIFEGKPFIEIPTYPTGVRRLLPWWEVYYLPMKGIDTEEVKQEWVAMHRTFQKNLEAKLPAHRLKVYSVEEGWPPLLDFLGVNDPALAKQPFPRVNDRTSLTAVRAIMDVIAAGLPLWALLMLLGIRRMVKLLCRLCLGAAPKPKVL